MIEYKAAYQFANQLLFTTGYHRTQMACDKQMRHYYYFGSNRNGEKCVIRASSHLDAAEMYHIFADQRLVELSKSVAFPKVQEYLRDCVVEGTKLITYLKNNAEFTGVVSIGHRYVLRLVILE